MILAYETHISAWFALVLTGVRNPLTQTFYNKGFLDASRGFRTLYAVSVSRDGQTPCIYKNNFKYLYKSQLNDILSRNHFLKTFHLRYTQEQHVALL